MARTVVVYDKGDIIGHYVYGIGTVLEREEIGVMTVRVKFDSMQDAEYTDPHMIYLIKDCKNIITGRTLRIYMRKHETIKWANQCHRDKKSGFTRRINTLEELCDMLKLKTGAWTIFDICFSELSHRQQNLLKSIKDKRIVVAIRKTDHKITVMVGEYQSREDNEYGKAAKNEKG